MSTTSVYPNKEQMFVVTRPLHMHIIMAIHTYLVHEYTAGEYG